jgi:hypothetical protein
MTAANWWAAGLAAAVVVVPFLIIQLRRSWDALVRRRQARLRAEALLWAWLSPAQRRQYRARRWFEVTAASGRRYRILRGGVVRLHPRGSGYCIEATSPVPVADEMLANKLLLETNDVAADQHPTRCRPGSGRAIPADSGHSRRRHPSRQPGRRHPGLGGRPPTAGHRPARGVATSRNESPECREHEPRSDLNRRPSDTSRMLGVGLVGSRRIWPAHVGCLVGLDGSCRMQKDRLDDQTDDQSIRRMVWAAIVVVNRVAEAQRRPHGVSE